MDDDSQPEEDAEKQDEADIMVIEVPDQAPPGSPQQIADAPSRSSQGSRPSSAGKEKEEVRGPGNQLITPWGQTEMQVNIGIDEVSQAWCLLNTLTLLTFIDVTFFARLLKWTFKRSRYRKFGRMF